ncbi:MAG TPA: DUF3467 domain-containing protein [Usitatibacter sp.]|nr:DUF3467 domain-containing protein [Usitatibacter sp.]
MTTVQAPEMPETDSPKVAVYANQFEVGFNAFEFLFDFGQSYEERAARHSRIVTTPVYAKVFRALLDRSINDYEEAFGVIPAPPPEDP